VSGWDNAILVVYPCGSGDACTNKERPGFHDEAEELRKRIDKYELSKACIAQQPQPKQPKSKTSRKPAEDRETSS
jgi:hypothetical protein